MGALGPDRQAEPAAERLDRVEDMSRGRVAESAEPVRSDRLASLMALAYDGCMRVVALGAAAVCRTTGGQSELAERLAHYPGELLARCAGQPTLWLHAASVGEMQGIRALVGPLRARFPGHAIVVSAVTRTGRALARTVPGVDEAVYFPLDARQVVRRALESIRPQLFAFTETELWPGFLCECAEQAIPCVLLSGRLSERSARRYAWVRPLMRRTLSPIRICMQSAQDARRIIAIGADPGRVDVLGNLKSDAPLDEAVRAHVAAIWKQNGVTDRVLFVGASTHHGEEDALLAAFARVERRCPETRLLLAPRHPERFGEVAELIERAGMEWARFTALEACGRRVPEARVVLLDRIGILRACFPLARLVFVGGTLASLGGHNLLEPAAEGCAVVFGPHTDHVADMARGLLATGGGREVADAEDLGGVVQVLLPDVDMVSHMGLRALEAAARERGAVARHLHVIASLLAGGTDGDPADRQGASVGPGGA